ncbi:MAG: ParA family protein [Rikenellaceae bacterium]
MGKIIALANQKGGVGKTTTAINIAASLAMMGHKTLIIDSDPQANATSGLGLSIEDKGVYDILIGNQEIDTLIKKVPSVEELFLIPSSINLAGAEVEMVGITNATFRLREALESIRNDYEYIFIDCSPSLGLITINALNAADSLLVPVQCEFFSLEGIGKLLNTFKMIKEHQNPDLEIEGFVLTMYDARLNIANQVASEMKEHFKGLVYDTIIQRNVRLTEAPSYGLPVIVYDPRSKGAKSYLSLAKELIERNN